MPLVPLWQMKQQIDAQVQEMGLGGNLQITGGDVVDAYWRAGKPDELIEVLQYACKSGLVPMLMTHGQILLEQPDYFARLVIEGGLRKLSLHIDITMAGRPGFSINSLQREAQLNPLRDQFVDLVLQTRKRTGKRIVAAQTVTVTEKNLSTIGDILKWLMSDQRNMAVTRTISFQPEADVGRTVISNTPITPERVWNAVSMGVSKKLSRDHLLFGHQDCTSVATLLVRARDQKIAYLSSKCAAGKIFWQGLMKTFGGLEASSTAPFIASSRKVGALIRRPGIILEFLHYITSLFRQKEINCSFLLSTLFGRVAGFNIVMHNFMNAHEVQEPRASSVQQRLDACAFKGMLKKDGEWVAVSMCEMNAQIRPELYREHVTNRSTHSKPV